MTYLIRLCTAFAVLLAGFGLPALANPDATQMLNNFRADKGRAVIRYSRKLERVAQAHAEDMRRMGGMTHKGSDGSSPGDRARRAGYKWCYISENVAQGYPTLADAMRGWANSKGHAKNMLNKRAKEFGLARVDGNFWVMVLAQPGCR
jgi:uncharacterized protein YkwD